jgi:hypothetical protein
MILDPVDVDACLGKRQRHRRDADAEPAAEALGPCRGRQPARDRAERERRAEMPQQPVAALAVGLGGGEAPDPVQG